MNKNLCLVVKLALFLPLVLMPTIGLADYSIALNATALKAHDPNGVFVNFTERDGTTEKQIDAGPVSSLGGTGWGHAAANMSTGQVLASAVSSGGEGDASAQSVFDEYVTFHLPEGMASAPATFNVEPDISGSTENRNGAAAGVALHVSGAQVGWATFSPGSPATVSGLPSVITVKDGDRIQVQMTVSATSEGLSGFPDSSLDRGHASFGARLKLETPPGVTFTSSSGVFLTQEPVGTPDNPILPPEDGGTIPRPGLPPRFRLPLPPCGYRAVCVVDPVVATGYDYELDPGLSNIKSILLPEGIGDGKYDLFLWDAATSQYVDSGADIQGGVVFDFERDLHREGGLARFSIRGIEVEANLDPNDPRAFVTGLTFVDYKLNGYLSMTPIAEETDSHPTNQPPIAQAGTDQSGHPGVSVALNGGDSSDPDGDYPLSYAWSFASKPDNSTAELQNANSVTPSFTPDVAGDYLISLTVTDARGLTGIDQVKVSTVNTSPVADAGLDQSVTTVGSTIHLDGRQSYDEDGDAITYQWTLTSKPQGSTATLIDSDTATPHFIADVNGSYALSLRVTDSLGAAGSDTVLISFDNLKPVADAGGNQAVLAGNTVLLNGAGSTDANLDPLTYQWNMIEKPIGSQALLSHSNQVDASFLADLPGNYILSLVVNDGLLNSEPSNITITAISRQDALTQELRAAITYLNGLDSGVFKNANMPKALTSKLNAVLISIDQEDFVEALEKLRNDVLQKSNGCAETSNPDANDWVTACSAQGPFHQKISRVIALLEEMR
ncbi:PKD domain-containing protein [Methylomicrobium sp. RS1]|uniref:PKD domain-containing protein n=1 Tax=Candidatus Methylomicrobium oryzae TaxID=2802053 RepID=UPI0019208CAC|nr:PKD domain-containing protein [Methylomicrobium sp. RS1]MBL1262682.1 hypothetical protein [Methylomicrobium sp. RS1]